MEVPVLGKLAPEDARRDCVHVAIAPVIAAEKLKAGTHVGLSSNGLASAIAFPLIGIVDPFLRDNVEEGQRFYLCLYPGTITSLRHQWLHPAFAPKVPTRKE